MKQQDFPILKRKVHSKRLIYLDNAATTQKPKQVIKAIKDFYENNNANVHRGIHTLSNESTVAYEKAHETVAKFINADKDEIIFTRGTTDSINMVVSMLEPTLKKGDEVILTELEHHSNLVPWQRLQKKGVLLKFIPVNHSLDLDMGVYKQLLTEKTKVVSFTYMSNVTGIVNGVKAIVQRAHKHNAIVVVDAAQGIAHHTIDIKNLEIDFLAFSGHKLYGPTGIGVLYGKKELLEKYDPASQGGGMIKEVTLKTATWNDLPEKHEPGTPHIAGALGLAAAIDYITAIGLDQIGHHTGDLAEYLYESLKEIPDVTMYGTMSFTIDGIHPHDVAHVLDQYGIAIRAGHHCCMPLMKKLGIVGTNRASFAIYNTKEDVDALVKAIKKTIEVFEK